MQVLEVLPPVDKALLEDEEEEAGTSAQYSEVTFAIHTSLLKENQ